MTSNACARGNDTTGTRVRGGKPAAAARHARRARAAAARAAAVAAAAWDTHDGGRAMTIAGYADDAAAWADAAEHTARALARGAAGTPATARVAAARAARSADRADAAAGIDPGTGRGSF